VLATPSGTRPRTSGDASSRLSWSIWGLVGGFRSLRS
jgi:hypothetical protein